MTIEDALQDEHIMWNHICSKVHAVSVPYAVELFQGTQLFNRDLTIKPRNNNSNSNAHQRVEISMPQLPQPLLPQSTMRNPFETNTKFGGNDYGSGRADRNREHQQTQHVTQYEQTSLRSGFNPIPTKASMQMQPQPSSRRPSQSPKNDLNLNDLNKLIALGSNMLQSSSHQAPTTRPTYDMLFTDRDTSKMTNRNNRSHYRDEPYGRRDPPRHQKRSSDDRRRR